MTFGTKNIYVLYTSACVRAKTLNIKLTNVLVSAQVYLREEEKILRKEDRTQQIFICAIGVVRRKYGSFLLGRIFKILVFTHSKNSWWALYCLVNLLHGLVISDILLFNIQLNYQFLPEMRKLIKMYSILLLYRFVFA